MQSDRIFAREITSNHIVMREAGFWFRVSAVTRSGAYVTMHSDDGRDALTARLNEIINVRLIEPVVQ